MDNSNPPSARRAAPPPLAPTHQLLTEWPERRWLQVPPPGDKPIGDKSHELHTVAVDVAQPPASSEEAAATATAEVEAAATAETEAASDDFAEAEPGDKTGPASV